MKNQISRLYSAVSAPIAASRDALAERLQSVRDTASLLYNRMMNNIGYGQETLKDIVENTAAKEEEEPQQQTEEKEEEEQEAILELTKEGTRVKKIQITCGMNRDNTKIIMDKITQHIEMRTKVVYSFKAEIHRGAGEIVDYSKTLSSPPGMFTSLKEIRDYIEECEQKWLDLDNEVVWSKAYLPATRTTKVKGNYQDKVAFKHVQIKLIASNEPLMGCGSLPEWLRKKRCISALDTFDDNLCVWRCLALYKRKDVKRGAERSTKEALKLAREYYADNKLERKDVRATKLVDFEGIAKHFNVNIMLHEPSKESLVYSKIQYRDTLPTINMGLFKGHYFYINKIDVLCQNWECKGCKQIFKQSNSLAAHLKEDRCTGGKIKLICSGRKFKRILNSSEKVFYGGETGFSYSACQWIEHMSGKTGRHIHHKMCGHGGERQVTVWYLNSNGKRDYTTYPVDGYEPETRTVYQFHGCKWHGHNCIKDRTSSQRERYLDTLAIDRLIENNGVDTLTHKNSKFNLVTVWECEKPYKKSVKFEKEFRWYPHFIVHDWEAIQKPLNEQPRDDLAYIAKHAPVSVTVCDTLSGESVYLVDKDPEKLVEKFMDTLSKKRDAIVKDVETKYPHPSDFMVLSKEVNKNWKEWVNQVPVVGFNSEKYDINLIKEYFV